MTDRQRVRALVKEIERRALTGDTFMIQTLAAMVLLLENFYPDEEIEGVSLP